MKAAFLKGKYEELITYFSNPWLPNPVVKVYTFLTRRLHVVGNYFGGKVLESLSRRRTAASFSQLCNANNPANRLVGEMAIRMAPVLISLEGLSSRMSIKSNVNSQITLKPLQLFYST